MSKLLNVAYGRAAIVRIALTSFHASGIRTAKRHIFTDDQFTPADVLQPSGTPDRSSSSDDDEDSNDNASQINNKRFKRLLEEIPSLKNNPYPDGFHLRVVYQ